jgi:hypothetical protein
MRIENQKDDELVTSWIAAESVRYLKSKNNFSAKDNKTKLHKIIYLIADEYDIPITRGWYLHGPFVYNDNVLNVNYKENIKEWTSSRFNINELNEEVRKYDLDVDKILVSIKEWSDIIDRHSADEFILLLYKKYSPKELREIYLNKYKLTGVRTNISHLINYYDSRLGDRSGASPIELLQHLYDDVDDFQNSAFNTFDDSKLEQNTIGFFDVFRDLLYKIELVLKEIDLDKNIINNLKLGQEAYLRSVWTPYGGNIIKKTAKGINFKNAKAMGYRTRRDSLISSPSIISEFDVYREKHGLKMSYSDMQKYYSLKKDPEFDKNLLKLVKISSGLESF